MAKAILNLEFIRSSSGSICSKHQPRAGSSLQSCDLRMLMMADREKARSIENEYRPMARWLLLSRTGISARPF